MQLFFGKTLKRVCPVPQLWSFTADGRWTCVLAI